METDSDGQGTSKNGEGDHPRSNSPGGSKKTAHGHAHDTTHKVGQPVSKIEVGMKTTDTGQHFMPHVAHIKPGGTVKWVLESGSHNTVAYHPNTHGNQQRIPADADPWKSERLTDKGDTFDRRFEIEGVYDYVCTPHEGAGMVGTIVVGWPDPAEQPGLEPPADDLPDTAVDQLKRYNDRVRTVLEGESEKKHNSGHDGDGHGDHTHSDGSHQ